MPRSGRSTRKRDRTRTRPWGTWCLLHLRAGKTTSIARLSRSGDCDYVGEGYGLIDQAVVDALTLAARTEGLLLDPVYTGKAMKGLIALARRGAFAGQTVVFLHTGGAQGLFGYHGELEGML
ncbi:MAG TPA: pyridoxal-phosphate dependent enzyme [Caulobacter sp.]|nr:pyridoxal-phosphate dependent enzyme [Caulobacter sp.]